MTALVPFAKPADLQLLVSTVSTDTAVLLLDLVSGAIRAAVGWDVDKVVNATYTKVIRPSYGNGCIEAVVLPVQNLTAVSSIVVDSSTTPLTADQWDATPAGVIYFRGVYAYRSVVVTYTAGYQRTPADQAPAVFRAVALDLAMRWAANPTGVKTYQMGGTSETFLDDIADLAASDSRLDPFRVNL